MPPDTQSAKGKRIVPVRGVGNKTEYSEQLTSLLASTDFRDRIKGIDQLLSDCQHNSNMVINTIFPVSPRFISAAFFVVVWMSTVQFDHFLKNVIGSSFRCLMPSRTGCWSPTAKSTYTPWNPSRKSSACWKTICLEWSTSCSRQLSTITSIQRTMPSILLRLELWMHLSYTSVFIYMLLFE